MGSRDLVIEDAVADLVRMEDVATATLQDAVAWRHVALLALAGYHAQWMRADRLEQRLRQVMGLETWHPEEI